MSRSLSQATLDAIAAAVAQAMAANVPTSAPVAPSEASQHYADRDIPCNAKKPCAKTFRTIKGRDWHVTNIHAAK